MRTSWILWLRYDLATSWEKFSCNKKPRFLESCHITRASVLFNSINTTSEKDEQQLRYERSTLLQHND
jgi:hypothetical protein